MKVWYICCSKDKKRGRDGVTHAYILLHTTIPTLPAYCHTYTLFRWFLAGPFLHFYEMFLYLYTHVDVQTCISKHKNILSSAQFHVKPYIHTIQYVDCNNNSTQKAAIASPPSTTHPQLWAELHIHVHASIQECTLSHLHLHPQVHALAPTHTLHAATDTLHA